jgi:Pyruvate/2-oxoglutarate dehydrogenase complex, dihydrolipoamide acyltransferase (E2) component, and related enzymes
MSATKSFHLPDLGEGLPDATIVEWFVKVGDVIKLDEPLVSMETAKAVVEVPSPVSGKVLRLAGAAGDIVITGHELAAFEIDPSLPQRAEGQDTGHHHGHAPALPLRLPPPRRRSRRRPAANVPMKAPWSGRWSPPMPCTPRRPLPSAASRRCRRCARWHASSVSTWPGYAPAAPMAR